MADENANIPEAICSVCHQSKPLTNKHFPHDTRRPGHFRSRCRACSKSRLRNWRFTHPVAELMETKGLTICNHRDDVGLLRIEFFPTDKTANRRTLRPLLDELADACDLRVMTFTADAEYRTAKGAYVVYFMTANYFQGPLSKHAIRVRNNG
jgi:hypothetical protein